MGMDMVTKGVHNVIEFLSDDSPDMDVIGISDNFFSDINKPTAVNCIEGHGSSLGRFRSRASNIVFDVFMYDCIFSDLFLSLRNSDVHVYFKA
ncbi:hypothetical protein F2Q68_00007703 [Brassica cretica]|uniref:Uncharacterized protein n=1 Tax=Brassica cretica TaxID=69181 RepID=A0A8S9KWS8_BRACR|nr:hypothetical protein F2Q68_00007703 [Brassica cretica]